ncbi:MAG: TylF/MycF/NovP-related O-methyltransferase [Candidatus Saccharibacteria bacterium]|nr:TylF/MycF/NovP-related O-methyltransferase [Candidatus Saccharibacteria bacterium]
MKNYLQQVSDKETEILLDLLEKYSDVEGDVVEFGCYKGDTSVKFQKYLQKNTNKTLWIYDSFEGLPKKTVEDASSAGDNFKEGELFVTKREVIEKFKKAGIRIPRIRKNFFENLDPASDLPEKISYAFLDGDLYGSIKTSLNLVLPKFTSNGVIVVHDYNNPELPGSARAVDEFMAVHKNFALQKRETLAIISMAK